MSDRWIERLEEYLDGLLPPDEAQEVEEALARDPLLRAELDRVRRFAGLMEEQTPDVHAVERILARMQTRRRLRLLAVAVPVAAALVLWLALPPSPPQTHPEQAMREIQEQWLSFGERLGEIAAERREGRVPQTGVGGLEIPPAAAYGIVFKGALARLRVPLDAVAEDRVLDLVRRHHERRRGQGLEAECERAEASLSLYRELARLGGAAVADAYYDTFRPGLTDLATTERVRPDSLQFVLADHERYREAYRRAVADLTHRFGQPSVAVVLDQLAPGDSRALWYDAAFDGVGRETVLAIRAQLYEAARAAGADKLYVEG